MILTQKRCTQIPESIFLLEKPIRKLEEQFRTHLTRRDGPVAGRRWRSGRCESHIEPGHDMVQDWYEGHAVRLDFDISLSSTDFCEI